MLKFQHSKVSISLSMMNLAATTQTGASTC